VADSNKKLFKQLEALHNAKRDLKDRPKKKKAKKPAPPKPKPLLHTPPPVSTLPSPAPTTLPTTPITGYYDQYATEGMNLMSPDFGHPQGSGSMGGWHSITSRAKAKQTKDTMKGLENYNKTAGMVSTPNTTDPPSGEAIFNDSLNQGQYNENLPRHYKGVAGDNLPNTFTEQRNVLDSGVGQGFDSDNIFRNEAYGVAGFTGLAGLYEGVRPNPQHVLRRGHYVDDMARLLASAGKGKDLSWSSRAFLNLGRVLQEGRMTRPANALRSVAHNVGPHLRFAAKALPFIEPALDVGLGALDANHGYALWDQHHKMWLELKEIHENKPDIPGQQKQEFNIPEPQMGKYIQGAINNRGDNILKNYMSGNALERGWYNAQHTFSPYSLHAAWSAANAAQTDAQESVQKHYSNYPDSLGSQLAHNAGFAENAPNFSYDLSSMPAHIRGVMGKHMDFNATLKRIDDDWGAWYHWNPYSGARKQLEKAFIHRPSAEDKYSVTRHMINEIRQENISKEDFIALVNAGVVELGRPNTTLRAYKIDKRIQSVTALGGWPGSPDEYYDTMQALPKDIKILPLQAPGGMTEKDLLEPPIEASNTDDTSRSQHNQEAIELQRDQQADELEEKML